MYFYCVLCLYIIYILYIINLRKKVFLSNILEHKQGLIGQA